ncbi:MAG: NAD+ synthase [Acidimicrobiia bacterium]|nr:NAD+ synthase [Acidimicrobiia bacterium]
MARRVRIASCQINTTVGDLDGNADRIVAALRTAADADCDLAVFPELTLTGYPPEDLVLRPGFVAANRAALEKVAARTGRTAAVVGFVDQGRDLYNAAALCVDGAVVGVAHKRILPNYGVFDEARTYAPGVAPFTLYEVAGVKVGITVCEDAWSPTGPVAQLAAGGAELVLNLNASPYHRDKDDERLRLISTRAADNSCGIVYVNLVGGQDELVFDGGSFAVDANGHLVAGAPQFVEDVRCFDLEVRPAYRKRSLDPRARLQGEDHPVVRVSGASRARDPLAALEPVPSLSSIEEVYRALTLGLGDYVRKNGFGDVVLGLSGGVDSSLVAMLAADALGPDRVHGVLMPSRYSSDHSVDDAALLAANLGIDARTIAIEDGHRALEGMLGPHFEGRPADLTEENLQSRIRGVVLMGLSNKLGWLVLTTSNKSESAVGYATLYGDTAGGFAVLKDVPKLVVYELCRWRNQRAGHALIPENVLVKAPSAELRPDQRDDQSLPPYEILDPILEAFVEQDRSIAEIVEAGFDPEVVDRVVRLVEGAEYKRRQTAPGVRITIKAFGKDRRLPITNRYRG